MGIEIKLASAPAPGISEARSHSNNTIGTQAEWAEGKLRGCFDFESWMGRHREWSVTAFGPAIPGNDRRPGVVDHIRKELDEVLENPDDLEEWADIVILATDGAWRAGASPHKFAEVLEAKQAKNRARSWPDWRTVPPTQAVQHTSEEAEELDGWALFQMRMDESNRLIRTLESRDDDDLLSAAERLRAERDRLLGEVGDLERALSEAPTHHQTVSALALEIAEAGQLLRGGESAMPDGLLELAKYRMQELQNLRQELAERDDASMEVRERDDALAEVRRDIAQYQEDISGLEAQVMDWERDVGHLRGQRAEMAELLAQVCHEADQEVE